MVNKQKRSKKLYKILKSKNIKIKDTPAIQVKKDSNIIAMLIESITKYNAFAVFICAQSKIILAPTHHMDIYIFFDDLSNLDIINNTILECNKIMGEDYVKITM